MRVRDDIARLMLLVMVMMHETGERLQRNEDDYDGAQDSMRLVKELDGAKTQQSAGCSEH